jgi:phosphate transport system protein
MVAEDLPGATYALLSGSSEVLGVLAEREQVIDALYREIDKLASREILLQAPVASDLRFLLSVVRVVPELERSHDLVVCRSRGQVAAGQRSWRGRLQGWDAMTETRSRDLIAALDEASLSRFHLRAVLVSGDGVLYRRL